MAPKKRSKTKIVAKLVTGEKVPCGFCHREVDDELTFGKLYAIGDIQCHYFCVLLSSCLIQKGRDEDGLFGFLYEDILTEIERAKKHKCSYCSKGGANLGCSVSQCRKQFHLPCGRERNAVSLFFGNYKSFCQLHAPKQNIPPAIMVKAKERRLSDGRIKKQANFKDLKELSTSVDGDCSSETDAQSVCVICYEAVNGYPTLNTFWPPCCARDAWFHRTCLQRMALSAGMHYLKCPLCNDKDNFYKAVVSQGYYVPDRDAAWELEQNAFAEIYEREVSCVADDCLCPMGRKHDAEAGAWRVRLCLLCGGGGAHAACVPAPGPRVCGVCAPAAPRQLQRLASCIRAAIEQEEAQAARRRRGPVMPARMSLRRTKRLVHGQAAASCSSSSQATSANTEETQLTRHHLNLPTPQRPNSAMDLQKTSTKIDFKTESPTKLLEESLMKGGKEIDKSLVEELRRRFRKPKPLSEKRKIVDDILNGVFDNLLKETKQKEAVKQWCSPKKCDIKQEEELQVSPPVPMEVVSESPINIKQENESEYTATPKKSQNNTVNSPPNLYPMFISPNKHKTVDIQKDSSLEISAKDEIINIDVIKLDDSHHENIFKNLELKSPQKCQTCTLKFSPNNKEVLNTENIDIDIETFKDQYLNEVGLQRVPNTNGNSVNTKRKNKRKRKRAEELEVKYESKKRRKKKNIEIKNKNIKVKIKWWDKHLKLKFTNSKKKKKKYKQYVLKYYDNTSKLVKPKYDVTLKKRKYLKQAKSPDNLVQTSIQKFFKITTPSKE